MPALNGRAMRGGCGHAERGGASSWWQEHGVECALAVARQQQANAWELENGADLGHDAANMVPPGPPRQTLIDMA